MSRSTDSESGLEPQGTGTNSAAITARKRDAPRPRCARGRALVTGRVILARVSLLLAPKVASKIGLFVLVSLAGLVGCTEDPGPYLFDAGPRDGSAMDGSRVEPDGGGMDATTAPLDASPADAGDVDAELTDAGAIGLDAEATDGGPMDAGRVSMPCTAEGACDPFTTTGCAAGSLCQPQVDGGTTCITGASTLLAPGATCTFGDECGPGTLCLNFGDGFKCQLMCPNGSIGFCPGESRCFGTIGDPCVRICRPRAAACDIFLQDCADAADTCTLATDPETGARYTGCRPAGTAGHLAPCGGASGACGHGLICINETVDGGTAARCRFVCGSDGGVPACTSAGEACTGFAASWRVPYCR